jgi:hypothetical protein
VILMQSDNKKGNAIKISIALIILIILDAFLLSCGCIGINTDTLKTKALDIVSPVVVLEGSTQYERLYPSVTTAISTATPTAIRTPTPIPTPGIKAKQVDAYATGERWEKQWYKHIEMKRPNQFSDASPKKPLEYGIVVYDHKFMSSYTWWSDANGQYYKEIPKQGYKFLFVWIHEEVFGDPKINIHNMYGFDERCFVVQRNDIFYYNDTTYNPVNRILEFDNKGDLYGISRTSAFGYQRTYVGMSSRYGGWIAEDKSDIYIGNGNAWDGYVIYQVPESSTDSDVLIVGNFKEQENAYWRFDIYAGN